MPGSIEPLPVMLAEEQQQRGPEGGSGRPPTLVARYGYMRMVAELPYDSTERPLPGSMLVIRTRRGIELAQMLACSGQGCGCQPQVERKQVLQYVESSGGRDYPFVDQGKVLRVATRADLIEQSRIDEGKPRMRQFTQTVMQELGLSIKLVDIESLLGGERIIFHYTAEQWVDFRDLVRRLAQEYQTRIEMHQVNARDEARLVADYEKCGQHCCCKQYLKVLRPVSMKSAKVQKATLDPSKISGRCGRLMCCLRYEDKTYDQLRKRLPHRQTRVQTPDGPGTVVNTQILAQLVIARLDDSNAQRAFPLEETKALAPEDDPRNNPSKDPRSDPRNDSRSGSRDDSRSGPRNAPRNAPRNGPREGSRSRPRRDSADGGREDSRGDGRQGQQKGARRDRRPAPDNADDAGQQPVSADEADTMPQAAGDESVQPEATGHPKPAPPDPTAGAEGESKPATEGAADGAEAPKSGDAPNARKSSKSKRRRRRRRGKGKS